MDLREGINLVINSKSRTFLLGCGLFILGIFLSLLLVTERQTFLVAGYWVILSLLFLFSWLGRDYKIRMVVLFLLLFAFGFLRGVWSMPKLAPDHVSALVGKKIEVVGTVSDVQGGVEGVSYVFKPEGYRGNILISAALYPRYVYGDKLKILCQFDFPDGDSAGYARYLSTRDIFATCGFAKIEKVGSGGGNILGRTLFNWRILLGEKINSLWPEPRASLMAGILYGERGSMPKSLKNDFSNSGLSHIVAVSGYNTSVIALVMMAVFIFIGCWRRQSFWLSSVSLVLFTLFTGATASVVRAAVMAIFVMSGSYLGRPARMLNSLLFAAALMLLFNPRILFDVGFQLSFVATVGVSYVGPLLNKYFIGNRELSGVKKLVSELFFTTLGALVITLPMTIYYFGKLPILAILANILVVGFIPVVMLLGFLALLLSFVLFPLGLSVAFAGDLGLRYIILVAEQLAVGSVAVSLPFIIVILIYLLIFFWLYRLNIYVKKSES